MNTLDIAPLRLQHGAHVSPEEGMCAMEATASIAGEPHSDRPKCASPAIAAFMRRWNDDLSDEDRTRLLAPLLPLVVGTRTTDEDEEIRAWMAADWLTRVHSPVFLRLAGLDEHAIALSSAERITDDKALRRVAPFLTASRDASRDAARYLDHRGGGDACDITIQMLQESAVELVRAMCAVGRERKGEG